MQACMHHRITLWLHVRRARAKNAQEAHAAIQPTDVTRTADGLAHAPDVRLQRLYSLIRARTLACQMADAIMQQVIHWHRATFAFP